MPGVPRDFSESLGAGVNSKRSNRLEIYRRIDARPGSRDRGVSGRCTEATHVPLRQLALPLGIGLRPTNRKYLFRLAATYPGSS